MRMAQPGFSDGTLLSVNLYLSLPPESLEENLRDFIGLCPSLLVLVFGSPDLHKNGAAGFE